VSVVYDYYYNDVLCDLNLLLTSRGKKARKGEKQKGGKKSQASEGGPTSPTEEKGEEDFIPPPTQVREGTRDRIVVIGL
jgi:hypothetical protein